MLLACRTFGRPDLASRCAQRRCFGVAEDDPERPFEGTCGGEGREARSGSNCGFIVCGCPEQLV